MVMLFFLLINQHIYQFLPMFLDKRLNRSQMGRKYHSSSEYSPTARFLATRFANGLEAFFPGPHDSLYVRFLGSITAVFLHNRHTVFSNGPIRLYRLQRRILLV